MNSAVNCYLIDDEIIVATIIGWNGQVTKMPREKFENLSKLTQFSFIDALNQEGGIYFLVGKDKIYVGQADITEKGTIKKRCIFTRVSEHKKEAFWNDWNEIITITSDVLTAGTLNFLENTFFNKIKEAGILEPKQTEPHLGKILPSISITMESFINHVENIFKVLGIKFLTPSKKHKGEKNAIKEPWLLYLKIKEADAKGIIKDGKIIVLEGSRLALTPTPTCPNAAKNDRNTYKDKISPKGELLEDIPFNSPSGASNFVCYASTDGYACWKYADGTPLKKSSEAV